MVNFDEYIVIANCCVKKERHHRQKVQRYHMLLYLLKPHEKHTCVNIAICLPVINDNTGGSGDGNFYRIVTIEIFDSLLHSLP